MNRVSTRSVASFAGLVAAFLFASIVPPPLTHAQGQSNSKYSNASITVRTSNGDEDLHVSGNGCSGTVSGPGLFIGIGDGCWIWSDIDAPRAMRVKITTDEITFARNGKNYSIHDAATVKQARALFVSMEDVMQQQHDLGAQQRALGEKQRALGEQQRDVKIKVPDMSADFSKVEADAKRLSAQGGTQSELGDLQSELGELQSRLGDLQSQAGEMQSKLGDQQSVLGDQQSALGDKQGELGEHESEMARQATRQLKDLLDQSVSNGSAKPE